MKGQVKWLIGGLLAIAAIVLVFMALSKPPSRREELITDQKARGALAKVEELRQKAKVEREQTQKRERAERRTQLVKDIRAAFDPKAEASVIEQPAWMAELRRGKPQPASEPCQKLERFDSVHWALNQIHPEAEDRISWLEIGLEGAQAKKIHRETGLTAARSLLAVFSLPRETRRENECGRGEGTFGLEEGPRLMKEITRILQAVETEPKAIGSSPAMLRQVLLKDLREQIAYLRSRVKAGRVEASAGGANAVRFVAEEATRQWNFTEKELGLTAEEIALLHQKG